MIKIIFKKYLLLIVFFFFAFITNAQKTFPHKTTIINNVGAAIKNVSLTVYLQTDSSFVTTQITDSKGVVQFYLEKNNYYCVIQKDSFVTKIFLIDSTNQISDSIFIQKQREIAETATVYANPIIIMEDTIQFNNSLFKNDSLKTLEEVLKKFPGVTIDREGNIEINGQKVNEILLEGKPLPMTDIKQLTQTLQAGLIDKIQFIDKKSESNSISKIEDGQRQKVINIKLKSKTKRSISTDYYAGIGNNNRTENRVNMNLLYNDFYANAWVRYSNSGRTEFTNINYFNPNGLSTGFNSNASLRFAGSKKWTVGGNIGINNVTTIYDEYRDRVLFLKDSLNYYTQDLYSESKNKNLNSSFYAKFIPDTLSEWNATANLNQGKTLTARNDQFATSNNSKILLNKGNRLNDGNSDRYNLNININGGRRSKNGKQSLHTSLGFGSGNNNDYYLQQNNVTYFRTTSLGYDTAKQKINTNSNNYNIRGNIDFYQKLWKTLRVKVGTGFQYTNRPLQRTAYLYNYTTGLFTTANNSLFNDVTNTTNVTNQNLGLVWTIAKKHNLSTGVSFNQQINTNNDNLKDTVFHLNTNYISPNFSYVFYSKEINANVSASFIQRPPTTLQLLPITDSSNSLFIRKGNPLLKNEQTINVNSKINKTPTSNRNKKNILSISITNNTVITKNRIANNTFFDPIDGKQVISPINLPQAISTSTDFYFNQYFQKSKVSISSRCNLSYQKDNNFLNGFLNDLRIFSIRPDIGFKYNVTKLEVDYRIGYLLQTNKYSLRPSQNINIGNFTNDASVNFIPNKKWNFGLDYQQTINNNGRAIQRVNNLNGKINYVAKWKKPKTTFSLQAFDILNQNTNLRQVITDYYEEYVSTNAVRRFILFSVFIRFNKFKAGKKFIVPQKNNINKNNNQRTKSTAPSDF